MTAHPSVLPPYLCKKHILFCADDRCRLCLLGLFPAHAQTAMRAERDCTEWWVELAVQYALVKCRPFRDDISLMDIPIGMPPYVTCAAEVDDSHHSVVEGYRAVVARRRVQPEDPGSNR